jgi:hypothetical protein
MTISSVALSSMLYNVKDPINQQRLLQLPLLNDEIYQNFEESLLGGYSVTNSQYAHFNNGLNLEEERVVSHGFFIDGKH